MKLKELLEDIEHILNIDSNQANSEVRIYIRDSQAMGPTPSVGLKGMQIGFDWDINSIILMPDRDLIDPLLETQRNKKYQEAINKIIQLEENEINLMIQSTKNFKKKKKNAKTS